MPLRRTAACLAALMSLAAVAACSGSSDNAGTASTTTAATGIVLVPPEPATTTSPAATTIAAPPITEATTVSGPDTTTTEPPTTTTLPAGIRTNASCPDSVPAALSAKCYRVQVPANWADPQPDKTVSLPVVVLPAHAANPEPDAIVVPAGGPGYEDLSGAEYWASTAFNAQRDIVLYDQRGTGLAEPSLECPERDAAWVANLQQDAGYETERAAIVDGLTACRARLEAAGIDMGDYDTEASVRDLDAIRVALGYDQWNILGISYASRLAEAAMRSTPDGIRSVILDSVYDVAQGGLADQADNAERSLHALADACAADAVCNGKYPDLTGTLQVVQASYDASPVEVDVDLSDGKGPQHFVITGDDMMAGLFQSMYDPTLIPIVPALISSLAANDTSLIPEFVRRGVPFGTGAADAMQHSVDCADNAGLDLSKDDTFVADPGPWTLFGADVTCAQWPVPPTSPGFNQPVVSDIPALVLAGAFDPVTPPDGTKRAAAGLTHATFGLWPTQGHGVTGEPCAVSIELTFLTEPTSTIDMSCLAVIKPPAFA